MNIIHSWREPTDVQWRVVRQDPWKADCKQEEDCNRDWNDIIHRLGRHYSHIISSLHSHPQHLKRFHRDSRQKRKKWIIWRSFVITFQSFLTSSIFLSSASTGLRSKKIETGIINLHSFLPYLSFQLLKWLHLSINDQHAGLSFSLFLLVVLVFLLFSWDSCWSIAQR